MPGLSPRSARCCPWRRPRRRSWPWWKVAPTARRSSLDSVGLAGLEVSGATMVTIAFIGSGNIGQAIAQRAIGVGHSVVMSNSRGPKTLARLVGTLGPRARAATATAAAGGADMVVVAIPLSSFEHVPVEPLAGKIVIDTGNYYAPR